MATAPARRPWYSFPVTQPYGVNNETGYDIGTPFHTQITTLFGGVVTGIKRNLPWGDQITIRSNVPGRGVLTEYFIHLDEIFPQIRVGGQVFAGEAIGLSGGQTSGGYAPNSPAHSTGPHIEFGFFKGQIWNSQTVNPLFALQGARAGSLPLGSGGGPSTSQVLATRGAFVNSMLAYLGNLNASPFVRNWLLGWMNAESGSSAGAQFNPLNTEQRAPGSWNFNSVGVQNFPTFAEGVQANADLIARGYPAIFHALRTNDMAALSQPSGGVLADLRRWTGSQNVTGYVSNILGSLGRGSGIVIGPGSAPAQSGSGASSMSTPPPSTSSGGNCDQFNIADPRHWYCLGQQASQNLVQNEQNALGTAITGALKAVGTSFVHATGASSAVDLEQRAGLIGGGIILFIIGLFVLFFSTGGASTVAQTAEEAGGAAEEAGGAAAPSAGEGKEEGKEEGAAESEPKGLKKGRTASEPKESVGKKAVKKAGSAAKEGAKVAEVAAA